MIARKQNPSQVERCTGWVCHFRPSGCTTSIHLSVVVSSVVKFCTCFSLCNFSVFGSAGDVDMPYACDVQTVAEMFAVSLSLSLSLCRFSGHWSLKYRKSLLLPLHFRTISTIIVSNCLRSSQVVLFIFSCLYETLRNIPTLDAILVCFEGILIVTKGGFCFPPPSVPHEWGSKKKKPRSVVDLWDEAKVKGGELQIRLSKFANSEFSTSKPQKSWPWRL